MNVQHPRNLQPGVSVAATAYVGLGGNLGDRAGYIRSALDMLAATHGIRVCRHSPMYETEPIGPIPQPLYLNAVAELSVELSPLELLDCLLATELVLGRQRHERWGPRCIDLDLLLYGDIRMSDERLILPHPRLSERAFVLVPLADLNRSLAQAHGLERLPSRDQVRRWGQRWEGP